MLQRLLTSQAFLDIDDKEFLDKIFAIIRDGIELLMTKVEFGFLDLSEDLMGVVSLEWQIP